MEVDESDDTFKVHYFADGEELWHGSEMEVRVRSIEEDEDVNLLLGWSSSED